MDKAQRHVVERRIVADNEEAAQAAFGRGEYVLCFLLEHSLVESLLRAFLDAPLSEGFDKLIKVYHQFLVRQGQEAVTFVDELTQMNRRRNRVVHHLWKQGYSATNSGLESTCKAAFLVYGLLIEWLETFDPNVTDIGFEYE